MIKIEWNPPTRQLSQFGWISLVGFPTLWCAWWSIAMLLGHRGPSNTLLVVLAVAGVVIFAASRLEPRLVRPVFIGLMLLAWPIGMAISIALMASIYYLLFTPTALVFRVLGRDPLNRKQDPEATSYWVTRQGARSAKSYLRLY